MTKLEIPRFSGNKDKDGIDPTEWLNIVKEIFENLIFLNLTVKKLNGLKFSI